MDNPSMTPDPPPYSDSYNTDSQAATPASIPQEPPPKYEPPKDGPYAGQTITNMPTAGYPPTDQSYPIQLQPGYGATLSQTIIIRDASLGCSPCVLECPHCQTMVTTQTTFVSGGLTWLTSGLICLFGCWLGCCLIPFCVPELQDVEHHCPSCGKQLGTFHRL